MSHLHQVKTLEILVYKIFVAKRQNDVEQRNSSSLTSSRSFWLKKVLHNGGPTKSATELEQIFEMQMWFKTLTTVCVYSNEKRASRLSVSLAYSVISDTSSLYWPWENKLTPKS